jgi:putative proteasome-type protease
MTYCVAIKLNAGLVFLSDSRTNAGLDQISTFRKMMVYEKAGDRFMVLLSAGNLSISQSVREILQTTQIKDDATASPSPSGTPRACSTPPACWAPPCAMCTSAMARRSSARGWISMCRWCLAARSGRGHAPVPGVFGGQLHRIDGRDAVFPGGRVEIRQARARPRAHARDTAGRGRQVRAGVDGQHAQVQPVGGLPLDLVVYEADRFTTDKIVCIDEQNPYFRMLHNSWGQKLREVFDSIEDPAWDGGSTDAPILVNPARSKPLKKITNFRDKLI